MSGDQRARLTLAERLALAAQSRASSPEAAAALVKSFAGLPAGCICCKAPDAQTLYDLTGEFWEDPRVDVDSYRKFCNLFPLAMAESDGPGQLSRQPHDAELRRPVWGTRVNNALVLLGEMLLDQAMGRRDEEVCCCLRMTLGQYLQAVSGPDYRRSASQAECFTAWRDSLLQETDADQPLSQALAGILRRYMTGWQVLDRLDYLLRCLGGLALCLEKAGIQFKVSPAPGSDDAGKGNLSLLLSASRSEDAAAAHRLRMDLRRCGIGRYPSDLPAMDPDCRDPRGYFLQLAQDYDPGLPDPGSEMEAGTLRWQLFLPDWQYGPETFRTFAKRWPYPEFGPLLAECLAYDRVCGAFCEVNKAVIDLYMLWVEPYLCLEQ